MFYGNTKLQGYLSTKNEEGEVRRWSAMVTFHVQE